MIHQATRMYHLLAVKHKPFAGKGLQVLVLSSSMMISYLHRIQGVANGQDAAAACPDLPKDIK